MSDSFTETTSQSWFSRLGSAIAGVLIGIILFVASFPLLMWNEGRAIKTAQGLTEGAGIVRSVAADKVDAANDGRLVHVSGMLSTGGPVADPDFAIRVQGVRLVRHVEMYQWKEETQTETRTKLGGGEERTTTYKYVRDWSDKPVDSTGEIIESGDPALDGKVEGPLEMIRKLAESPRAEQVFVRHAFRFWMGRNETLNDGPVLQDAYRAYRDGGGSMNALLTSLLTSDAFLYRTRGGPPPADKN